MKISASMGTSLFMSARALRKSEPMNYTRCVLGRCRSPSFLYRLHRRSPCRACGAPARALPAGQRQAKPSEGGGRCSTPRKMLREGEMSIFEPLKKEREIKTLTLGCPQFVVKVLISLSLSTFKIVEVS